MNDELILAVGEAIVATFHKDGIETFRKEVDQRLHTVSFEELASKQGISAPFYISHLESIRNKPVTVVVLGKDPAPLMTVLHQYLPNGRVVGFDATSAVQALWTSPKPNDGRIFVAGDISQELDRIDVVISKATGTLYDEVQALERLLPVLASNGLYIFENAGSLYQANGVGLVEFIAPYLVGVVNQSKSVTPMSLLLKAMHFYENTIVLTKK